MKTRTKQKLLALAGCAMVAVGVRAGTATFDLNTDPATTGDFNFVGSAEWKSTGGVNDSGFIKLTDATGQSCAVLFPDFDQGLVVKAFTFECMIKCGDWYANPPADGFSVNFANANDPIIGHVEAGENPGRGSTSEGWAGSGDNGGTEDDLPEEGTKTGIAIGFDTWGTGNAPVGGSNGATDVRGISVRVDGVQLTQVAMPSVVFSDGDAHDFVNDATTLITGPFTNGPDPANANQGNPDNGDGTTAPPALGTKLNWAPLKVTVAADGTLNVFWKNQNIVKDLKTSYGPRPGRIIFGASTGGAMEFAGIDNIKITTVPSDLAIISGVSPLPGANGFTVTVSDSGASVTDPNNLGLDLKLDGTAVTPASATKDGGTLTITYTLPSPQLFASGSTHTVSVAAKDSRGQALDPVTRTITAPSYAVLNVANKVAGVDTTKGGFNIRTWWVETGQENTVARAEEQLMGLRGPNTADPADSIEEEVIDYDQAGGSAGNFHFPEKTIPGIPSGDQNNIAMEIWTYIEFPTPGLYTLIFNSDDGFRTTSAANAREALNSQIISVFDAGRGASDTAATFQVTEPGFYGFRTVWFEGGGGANMEWVGLNQTTGVKALINDPNTPGALKAYRVATGTIPAAVIAEDPVRLSGNPYLANVPVTIEIQDGTTAVDQSSIVVKVDGATVTPASTTKAGDITTVVVKPAGLWAAGNHTVNVSFTAGSQSYSGDNAFTVAGYVTVPASMKLPDAEVDKTKSGFLVRTVQTDTQNDLANEIYRAEGQLRNLYGLNTVDPGPFTVDGPFGKYYVETGAINYTDTGGLGNFATEDLGSVPGIQTCCGGTTGSTAAADATAHEDNYAEEILTVLEFKVPGLYIFNVASDDGFQNTIGNPLERVRFQIGSFNGGRGIGGGTTYSFNIPEAGLYPFRLIWFEGGGGSAVEWSTFTGADGTSIARTLINDASTPNSIAAYQYPVASKGAPYIESLTPSSWTLLNGSRFPVDGKIQAVLVDGAVAVDKATITLKLDGAAVTPSITSASGKTTVSFQPAAPFVPGSAHTLSLSFNGRTVNRTFSVGYLPSTAFLIEAEDFNYDGGKTKTEASTMPYFGGAYSGLGAVDGVDYHHNEASSPIYRNGESPNVPMDPTNDRDRGNFEIDANFKIGWIGGTDQFFNYTRTFPAGSYHVYAALSFDGDDPGQLHGTLQKVTSDPTQPNQTLDQLGTFDSRGSRGWGRDALVPLKDANGNLATVNLSGATTIRYSPNSGDYDFLLFVPPTEPVTLIAVTKPGDPITAFGGTTPGAEGVEHAIDQLGQKYLNFGGNGGSPFKGPVGFIVTPSAGATVVTGLRIYTANDASERDPVDYVLEGSNDGGTTWTQISAGPLLPPPNRNPSANAMVEPLRGVHQEVQFANTTAYTSYKWTVNNVRDNNAANSMQVSEVELLGAGGTPPPPIRLTITRSGNNITITWTGGGTLESADAVTGPYTSTGNSTGTFTTTASGAAKFYRVTK